MILLEYTCFTPFFFLSVRPFKLSFRRCRKTPICLWCALQQAWIRSLILLLASIWTMLPVSHILWKRLAGRFPFSYVSLRSQSPTTDQFPRRKGQSVHDASYQGCLQVHYARLSPNEVCPPSKVSTPTQLYSQFWLNRLSVHSPRFQHVFCFYHNCFCASAYIALSWVFLHAVPCRTRPRRMHVPH